MAPILIIFFAMAMVIGPILMMRPTASQSRLASLRTRARQLDMRIRMDRSPFDAESRSVAVYCLFFSKKKETQAPFSLFRKNYSHDIHFYQDWDWHKRARLSENQRQGLREFVKDLPASIVGVEASQAGVGLFWREHMTGKNDEDALQTVLDKLQTLRALLQA